MKQCYLCGSTEHNTPACPMRTINVDLTVGEWLEIHIRRKYGSMKAAARAMGVANSTITMYVHGARNAPPDLLADAGISFKVGVQP